MSRNLVICCDGTSNEFGHRNTNVVRLIQSLDRGAAANQIVYYDPGVGTMPGDRWRTQLAQKASQVLDLAVATGLEAKVEHAYRFLMNSWQPGDDVYLFGFSRGAYTARVFAGMLHTIGLLPAHCEQLFPYAMKLFRGVRSERRAEGKGRKTYFTLADEFRESFAQTMPGRTDRHFAIRFVGLWDTVSSVGLPWEDRSFSGTRGSPSIATVRHAVALDERRAFFRQNLMKPQNGQDFQERWFAGVHCDVGGGYAAPDGGVCAAAFDWILDAAAGAGLRLDAASRAGADAEADLNAVWRQPVHESLSGAWWLLELFPKPTYDWQKRQRGIRVNFGRHRFVRPGDVLHRSLVKRIREDPNYTPPNLDEAFINRIRNETGEPIDTPYQ